MKQRTKILSLFLALCVGLTGGATAAGFRDVPEGSPHAAALEQLAERGVVKGMGGDQFCPEAPLTTAQLVTLLGRISGAGTGYAAFGGIQADGWSDGYLAWAVANGLLGDAAPGQYDSLTAAQADGILAAFCAMVQVEPVRIAAAGNTVTRGEAADALARLGSFTRVSGVKYTTVISAEDWGPAITKVVLDLGVSLDKASISKDAFTAASVRTVPGFDFATYQSTPAAPQTVPRAITAAYLSDAQGAAADSGTHITLEMAIGPTLTEASPFHYDFTSGFNTLIDTSYAVALKPGAALKTADGKDITMDTTNPLGAGAGVTPAAHGFDTGGVFTAGDITLTYASWSPKPNAAKGSTPLVIWLHGAGEGGTDPYISIVGNKVVNLASQEIQSLFGDTGATLLAPQTPTMWLDRDGSGTYMKAGEDTGRSYYTDALMDLIKDYVAKHPEVDAKRVYLGGCSNGGYMTVNMLAEFPGYFAAAFPVCEAYDASWLTDAKLAGLTGTPIWLTHAKTDGTVAVFKGQSDPDNFMVYNLEKDAKGESIPLDNFSNNLYNRLVAAGAKNVHYSLFDSVVDTTGKYFQADGKTPYEYMGHWSWLYTLNNECVETIDGKEVTLFQWLAQQKLG